MSIELPKMHQLASGQRPSDGEPKPRFAICIHDPLHPWNRSNAWHPRVMNARMMTTCTCGRCDYFLTGPARKPSGDPQLDAVMEQLQTIQITSRAELGRLTLAADDLTRNPDSLPHREKLAEVITAYAERHPHMTPTLDEWMAALYPETYTPLTYPEGTAE